MLFHQPLHGKTRQFVGSFQVELGLDVFSMGLNGFYTQVEPLCYNARGEPLSNVCEYF